MRVNGMSPMTDVSVVVVRVRPEALRVLVVSDDGVSREVVRVADLRMGFVVVGIWPGTPTKMVRDSYNGEAVVWEWYTYLVSCESAMTGSPG
jgi:hypothetical protein